MLNEEEGELEGYVVAEGELHWLDRRFGLVGEKEKQYFLEQGGRGEWVEREGKGGLAGQRREEILMRWRGRKSVSRRGGDSKGT